MMVDHTRDSDEMLLTLQRELRLAYRHGDLRRVEEELTRRGYVKNGRGNWHKPESSKKK
jgi:hypothetical protein